MVFSSLLFIMFFLPIVLVTYFCAHSIRAKNIILVVFSLLFYAWGGEKYVVLLIGVTFINYISGLLIWKFNYYRRIVLLLCIVSNIGVLGYFKYFNFIVDNVNKLLITKLASPRIVLPIGISFYIFQGMSYVIDVYRYYSDSELNNNRGCAVQKKPLNLLLYISLFPQLIAGPIVRYIDINEQISERKSSLSNLSKGIELFVIGLAKKVIIADSVGKVADSIFGLSNDQLSIEIAWIGALCYTVQIYFDFMGYSDMAIGLAKMFGFEFKENFNRPYVSRSVSEFWRRWHISLSSWFRDYVYIPLGGSRRGNVYLNLVIVFLLTGIWHGSKWSFIAWGIWHGMFVVIERWLKEEKNGIKLPMFLEWLYTMLVVIIGWVLFREESIRGGFAFCKRMIGIGNCRFKPYEWRYYLDNKVMLILLIAIFISLCPIKKILGRYQQGLKIEIINKIGTVLIFIISIVFMINSNYSPFIYFRF